jgi:uncharacterized membrane protein
MAFCAKCGAQVSGAFCPQCGAPAAQGGAPPAYTAPPGPGPSTAGSASSGLTDNVAAMLCYVTLIPPILFLLMAPYNQSKNVRFHAFQSIFLTAAMVVFLFGFKIGMVFHSIVRHGNHANQIIFLIMLVWLAILGLWIYLLIQTYNNKKVVLPIIGPLAEKQA